MSDFERLMNGKVFPSRITEVIENLEKLYGGNLVVTSASASEITFSVRNLTDKQLISKMMSENSAIFGAALSAGTGGCVSGPPDFQILCAQAPVAGSDAGLLLRYLPNIPNSSQYLSGYWFY